MTTPGPVFVWHGRELATIGDLEYAMWLIFQLPAPERQERATEFMREYRAVTEQADTNIGYLTGYFVPKEADEMRALFGVEHPIFGRESPSPEKALEAGKRAALGEFGP